MSGKYTPGPWIFEKEIAEVRTACPDETSQFGNGAPIVDVPRTLAGFHNAQLIATAPDLLNLAEYVKGCLDENGECVIKLGQPMDKIVTKLVAKARGEL